MLTITNTTKALLIAAINAILAVVTTFDLGLTQAQLGAIGIAVNAILALVVAVTFKQSKMRLKHPRDTSAK